MWRRWFYCQEKKNKSQKVVYFQDFSEVRIRSQTLEKARLFYMETYLLRNVRQVVTLDYITQIE